MYKMIIKIALFLLPLSAAYAGTASWTQWSGTTGTFTQGSNSINVTYSGDYHGTDHNSYIYDKPSSFTTPQITNTPGTNGTIVMYGGSSAYGEFTFDKAVINPVIALFSVGQPSVAVDFVFDTSNFSILAQGSGHWGGGSLTKSGNTVTGLEGNGLLQFYGSFTSIRFDLPDYEYYYGATVGAPSSVPVPAAVWLFGSALVGLAGFMRKTS